MWLSDTCCVSYPVGEHSVLITITLCSTNQNYENNLLSFNFPLYYLLNIVQYTVYTLNKFYCTEYFRMNFLHFLWSTLNPTAIFSLCVYVFLQLYGHSSVQIHDCVDILAGPHNITWLSFRVTTTEMCVRMWWCGGCHLQQVEVIIIMWCPSPLSTHVWLYAHVAVAPGNGNPESVWHTTRYTGPITQTLSHRHTHTVRDTHMQVKTHK